MDTESHPIPVVCDRCRTEGAGGQEPFAAFAGLLDFAPVPRRPRAGGWSGDVQRAFIAALAVTGSPRRSAAAVGRAAFGVQQLRRAPGSQGFNAAYDRALAVAKEKGARRLAAGVAAAVRADAEADRLALPAPPPDPTADPAAAIPPEVTPESTKADRERLRALTLHRALHGDEVPVFHGGRQVGVRRVYNDRLALHHLKEAEGGAAGGASPRGGGQLLTGRDLRLHRMLIENPYWTRAFADKLLKHGDSIVRQFPRPWQFGSERNLLEELGLYREAFRKTLEHDPARAAAYETLFGPEGTPEDFLDALRHAAIIFECFFPGVDKVLEGFAKMAIEESERRRAARAEGRDERHPLLPPPEEEEKEEEEAPDHPPPPSPRT